MTTTAGVRTSGVTATAALDPDTVALAGVVGQAALMREGHITAAALTEINLARIARLDPELGAFRAVLADRARAEAAQADLARAGGDDRPLLGISVAVKDVMPVAGAPTYSSGLPPTGDLAAEDGPLVRALREAGAVVIGTTTVPELCLTPWTSTSAFGAARNPWSTDHASGGSSGGSAAAVAAGLVPLATASDGGGSIRLPAAFCGLVGLKPGHGIVPGKASGWQGLSTDGFLTRTVADTSVALAAVTGGALGDLLGAPGMPDQSLKILLIDRGGRPGPIAAGVRSALDEVAELLRAAGHTVTAGGLPFGADAAGAFTPRMAAGAREDWQKLTDAQRAGANGYTRSVVKLGAASRLALPLAHRRSRALEQRLLAALGSADLVLSPTSPLTAPAFSAIDPTVDSAGSAPRTIALAAPYAAFTAPFNVVGWPALSVPSGRADGGLPTAVQLAGRPGSESLLLAVGAFLQAQVGWASWRPAVS